MQEDDRLEQARKVQNLLSSLGGMGAAPAAPSAGPGGQGGPGMPPARNLDPRRQSYDYPTAPTTNMPPPTLGGGIPPEVLSLLNANNAGSAGMNMGMGGPTDAYRPPSAQSHNGPGLVHGSGGAPMQPPLQTPPRAAGGGGGRMSASLSPVVRATQGFGGGAGAGAGPAGGIPGLPPKPVDIVPPAGSVNSHTNGHGNVGGGQGAVSSTEVGNLLAMLVSLPLALDDSSGAERCGSKGLS